MLGIEDVVDGQVTFITGPVCAGKSTRTYAIYNALKAAGTNVLYYTYDLGQSLTRSHDDVPLNGCVPTKTLPLFRLAAFAAGDVVIVDEVQFFDPDAVFELVDLCRRHGFSVVLSGLTFDYRRYEFNDAIIRLLNGEAARIVRLRATCAVCGAVKSARYSQLLSDDDDMRTPTGSNFLPQHRYEPRCDGCFES